MKIIAKTENKDIATVYIAELNGKRIEFVESVQPPIPRKKKWVLIISSLYGCPINCQFCDAGGNYHGKMSKSELLTQTDFLINNRFPNSKDGTFDVPVEKFKIQFARVGEPAFNYAVIEALAEMPKRYNAPGLLPSVSTVAPYGTDKFFKDLIKVKNELYKEKFQMQFSIHTTDVAKRNILIPGKKWDFDTINDYGRTFFNQGERKLTLNFAINNFADIDRDILLKHFDPKLFILKITPINPTFKALKNNLAKKLDINEVNNILIPNLNDVGFDTILSIGELEENNIGSNCGQYIEAMDKNKSTDFIDTYTYEWIEEN